MLKNTFRKIISRLYFKYVFRKERFAQEIVFYLIPSSIDKKGCSAILAQIEAQLNNPHDQILRPARLRPLALGPLDDLSVEGEVNMVAKDE